MTCAAKSPCTHNAGQSVLGPDSFAVSGRERQKCSPSAETQSVARRTQRTRPMGTRFGLQFDVPNTVILTLTGPVSSSDTSSMAFAMSGRRRSPQQSYANRLSSSLKPLPLRSSQYASEDRKWEPCVIDPPTEKREPIAKVSQVRKVSAKVTESSFIPLPTAKKAPGTNRNSAPAKHRVTKFVNLDLPPFQSLPATNIPSHPRGMIPSSKNAHELTHPSRPTHSPTPPTPPLAESAKS